MKYKITIIKYEKNDNYEAEMTKWKEDNRNGYFPQRNGYSEDAPKPENTTRSLEVLLTEEEYNAVKKSVLETFK